MNGGAPFAAAIFDMDGVLIDSEPLWRIAEQEVFARVGLELDDAMCERTMGRRTDEVVAYWFERAPWSGVSTEQVAHEITRRVAELIRSRGEAKAGVRRLVALLEGWRLPLAIASSSPASLIEVVLDRLNLRRAFSVLVSAENERRGKPDPAVFLTAARRLQAAPEHCVVFEDSGAGVRAARAAGMVVVAIPEPHQAEDVVFGLADLVLPSLEELDEGVLCTLSKRVATARVDMGLPGHEKRLKLESNTGLWESRGTQEAGHDPD